MERDILNEFSSALADIDATLQSGNANADAIISKLGELIDALRMDKAPHITVQAPEINIPAAQVQVMPAPHAPPQPMDDWEHVHIYDERGRCIKTLSTRVARDTNV